MTGVTVNSNLGPYRLLESIGEGGMAEVFSAEIEGADKTKRRVALKILPANLAKNPEFVDMLADEAKVAVRLHHPNVVQSFELGCIDGTYFISMEQVEGLDLLRLLTLLGERGQKLPIAAALFISHQILCGLAYAHTLADEKGESLRLIHRDISPPNVLLSRSGQVKLADFGIAKAARLPGRTQAGVIKGKLEYMSPEQLMGKTLDQRSDIFSAGVVIHEILTNQPMYGGLSQVELISAVRNPVFKPPSTVRPELPSMVDDLLRLALTKEPDKRWATAAAFAQALSSALDNWQPGYGCAALGRVIQTVLAGGAPQEADATSLDEVPALSESALLDMRPEDFVVHQHAIVVEVDRKRGFEGYDQPTVVDMRSLPEEERAPKIADVKTADAEPPKAKIAAKMADGPTLIVAEDQLPVAPAASKPADASAASKPADAPAASKPADLFSDGGGPQPVKTGFVSPEDLLHSLPGGQFVGAAKTSEAPAPSKEAEDLHERPTMILDQDVRAEVLAKPTAPAAKPAAKPAGVQARPTAVTATPSSSAGLSSAPSPGRLSFVVALLVGLLVGGAAAFFGPRLLGVGPASGERVVTVDATRSVRQGSWQLQLGVVRIDSVAKRFYLGLRAEHHGKAAATAGRYLFVRLADGGFVAPVEEAVSAAELSYRLLAPLPKGALTFRFAPPDAPSLQIRLPRK